VSRGGRGTLRGNRGTYDHIRNHSSPQNRSPHRSSSPSVTCYFSTSAFQFSFKQLISPPPQIRIGAEDPPESRETNVTTVPPTPPDILNMHAIIKSIPVPAIGGIHRLPLPTTSVTASKIVVTGVTTPLHRTIETEITITIVTGREGEGETVTGGIRQM
jgi:hypothetical protein